MAEIGSHLSTKPPEQPTQVASAETNTATTPVVETPQTPPTVEEPPKVETPKADEFIENLNKKFGTQYKTEDELKNIFGLPKKVTEYETELATHKMSIEDYKKKIEELEELRNPLKYFSSPQTYIAEQLRIKYPKSNPVLLQEIATTDVSKMSDLDVLVKDKQLFVQDAPREEVIKKVVLKKYGIDPATPVEEWDEVALGEMKLDAAIAREKINTLRGGIEMPVVPSKEQRAQEEAEAKAKQEQAVAPLKEKFLQYDKFSHKDIQGFEMDIPVDFKRKLPDMIQGMIDSGLEGNQEDIDTAMELRDASFVLEYLPKFREIWIKEGETKVQVRVDAELNNTEPPNTATRTDQQEVKPQLPGLSDLLKDLRSGK